MRSLLHIKFGQYFLSCKFDHPGKATVFLDNIVIKNLKGELVEEIFMDKFNQNAFKSPDISVVKF